MHFPSRHSCKDCSRIHSHLGKDFQECLVHVQVHRGVYVAAEILYERFKPMVEEQLASSPFAKVAFTVIVMLVLLHSPIACDQFGYKHLA